MVSHVGKVEMFRVSSSCSGASVEFQGRFPLPEADLAKTTREGESNGVGNLRHQGCGMIARRPLLIFVDSGFVFKPLLNFVLRIFSLRGVRTRGGASR